MTNLMKLTLSDASPRERVDSVVRNRLKLIEQLNIQITAAECAVNDEEYLHSVRQWVRVEGEPDKQLITKAVPVRRWWWTNKSGTVMMALRRGNRVVELGEGKQSVEVGPIDKLPDVLRTLREAAIPGELDEQLKPTPFGRPLPKKGGKV